jgi:hypothetical protein
MHKPTVACERTRVLARQKFRDAVWPFACSALFALAGAPAQAASPALAFPDLETWGKAIAQKSLPGEGCFIADYPAMMWKAVRCGRPHVPTPPPARGTLHPVVGHGTDYEAVVSPAHISSAVGSFPVTKGVVSEADSSTGVADVYSLQINSQYISGAPICAHAAVPANCKAWEQFVFDDQGNASQSSLYTQYWLLNYGTTCPKGWELWPNSEDCTRNGNTNYLLFYVAIQNLSKIKLSASATAGGTDKAVLITPSQAYGVGKSDSVIGLANYWNAAEFNVFGGGGGSDANFNSGTSITVRLTVRDGSTNAPTCKSNAGTTGEGNNLNLHQCYSFGGSQTYVRFSESN